MTLRNGSLTRQVRTELQQTYKTTLVQILSGVRSLASFLIISGGLALSIAAQDKTPIIIIPGITGSEMVNGQTGEKVWFRVPRSKVDDLRLPVVANPLRTKDHLIPGDILRNVKFGIFPSIDVYGGLIDSLVKNGGYHEESWDSPTKGGSESAIYVFPYDWRLDNVVNARLLVRKIAQLRIKLKRPGLKFNVVAHSMGGIIARYAAMYGDVDLPPASRKPVPSWAGAKLFDKIILLGTPNEGSVLSLNTILNGFAIGGININLPWIQNLSKFDLFTIPAGYQLLPAPGTLRALDQNFEPIAINLYDPKEWSKYGWNVIDDKGFDRKFTLAERRAAKAYFAAVLDRARRLHQALAAGTKANGVEIDTIGGDCKDSLDAIVLYQEPKSHKWRTLFKASAFAKSGGEKVTSDELKKEMYTPGDGVVTTRSLNAETESKLAGAELIRPVTSSYICEEHNKLAANADVQKRILAIFAGLKP